MRYYFHLESETSVHIDDRGQDIPDLQDVALQAVAMARVLARDAEWHGWSVVIVDAHNAEVLRLPVADAVRFPKAGTR